MRNHTDSQYTALVSGKVRPKNLRAVGSPDTQYDKSAHRLGSVFSPMDMQPEAEKTKPMNIRLS